MLKQKFFKKRCKERLYYFWQWLQDVQNNYTRNQSNDMHARDMLVWFEAPEYLLILVLMPLGQAVVYKKAPGNKKILFQFLPIGKSRSCKHVEDFTAVQFYKEYIDVTTALCTAGSACCLLVRVLCKGEIVHTQLKTKFIDTRTLYFCQQYVILRKVPTMVGYLLTISNPYWLAKISHYFVMHSLQSVMKVKPHC